ncbi:MAG: GntR family transcriptional regulator [Burkholderiaceae bacterium]
MHNPLSTINPIRREGLHQAIVNRLREAIVEGKVTPGSRLSERLLCEQMGVSRTPMREAFKVLAGEGLIQILPNKGAVVPRMSIEEVAQTFEVIASLEGLSGQLAAQRASAEQIQKIQKLQLDMESAHQRKNLSRYYSLNSEIHSLIAEAAHNPILKDTYVAMNARLQSLRFRSNLNQSKWDKALREHAQIARALVKRDGAKLADLLVAHLKAKSDIVVGLLKDEFSKDDPTR